ncbi:MAG: amino acid decarboxylase [Eubacterium sp.]|nr:amino acid decarboxylase [Eubacterium sp.]
MSDNENYILYPIKKFIEGYTGKKSIRLHMPGHKGQFGYEEDITEIPGADNLYSADGIIAESEAKTAELFGSRKTCYGTEGASQIIKAMCYMAIKRYYEKKGLLAKRPIILATRNAHKSFIHAAMLLDFDIKWIYPDDSDKHYSLCKCNVSPERVEKCIVDMDTDYIIDRLAAVYITSPDYLGNMQDISGIAEVVHNHGQLLLCDNAHGAYLKFLKEDMHPITKGADIVADSAHKTLPVLTGGAYLHISKSAPEGIEVIAKKAMLMFGSTSPSYPILKSLDEVPDRISPEAFAKAEKYVGELKQLVPCIDSEPFKITIPAFKLGMSGYELADKLRRANMEAEYADPDYVVTMWSPYNKFPVESIWFKRIVNEIFEKAKDSLEAEFADITVKKLGCKPRVRYQPYEVLYTPSERVEVNSEIIGRVAGDSVEICPPAIAPVVVGEVIDEDVLEVLKYYGIKEIDVLKLVK